MRSIKIIPLLALLFIWSAGATEIKDKPLNGWSTYSNTSLGFSFQYPQSLVVTNRDVDSFHIEGLVFCLELHDKNNPNVIALRIMVREPSNNPLALKKDIAFLRKVCKKYRELTIGDRKAVNCVTCGRGACHWAIIFPGEREIEVFTMLSGVIDETEPKDSTYPLKSIIHSLKFIGAN